MLDKNKLSTSGDSVVTEESKLEETNNTIDGEVKVSDDVLAQIALSAMATVPGVEQASPGLMANLRLGRKMVNGIRVSTDEEDNPEIIIDLYVAVKYGLRIPDVCWDVQEAVKEKVEKLTGYTIKNVNVYVQEITFPNNEDISISNDADSDNDIDAQNNEN
ncbi:MAG: Asp23/Gls24 family envelope stress response protein [Synergistaceae bacterium]